MQALSTVSMRSAIGQMGDVFKHMNLPVYDAKCPAHVALAKLVEKAHGEHSQVKRGLIVAQVELAGEAILSAWIAAKPRAGKKP